MATKKELTAMSIEDLEKHIQDLDEEKQAIRAEQLEAHEVLDAKNLAAEAEARLESMDDAQKEALRQALKPRSIKSEEKAGIPGK